MSTPSSISQFDHFIPVSTSGLVHKIEQSGLSEPHLKVIHLLRQVLAYRFYQRLIALKKQYQPFNPDRELLLDEPLEGDAKSCINELRKLLLAANYSELNQRQIEIALEKTSPYGLEISINFDHFADIALFYRGKSNKSFQVRDWKHLFLKKRTVNLLRYQRLFLLIRYKDSASKPGIHLKLFKDILRPDLEMLFPNSQVRIKTFDKLKIGITGGGGTAGGLFATISKITAAVNPWTIVIAVTGFVMLIWRQISKIFIQKTRYMATLAQNLYFHNLDNNAGAITYLVDLARQEEIKEAILAYALLNSRKITDKNELDNACEQWFMEHFDTQIDFDVSDAVDKLMQLKILDNDQWPLKCKPPSEISQQLSQQWQTFTDYVK